MRSLNLPILSAGNAAGDLVSQAVALEQQFGFAIQAVITGSPVGVLTLQGSNDFGTIKPAGPDTGAPGVANWSNIADSDTAVSGAGTAFWNYDEPNFKWVRAIYTRTSGTGTITIRANTKGF